MQEFQVLFHNFIWTKSGAEQSVTEILGCNVVVVLSWHLYA